MLNPPTSRFRYIPFSEAHPRPLLDLTMPVLGRIVFPKSEPLAGISSEDDPRFIAGYITGNEPIGWVCLEGLYLIPAKGRPVPVAFPPQSQLTNMELGSGGSWAERTSVTIAFQPDRLPARLGSSFRIRELVFNYRVVHVNGDHALLALRIDAPVVTGEVELNIKTSPKTVASFTPPAHQVWLRGYPMTVTVEGMIKGTAVIVEGKITYKVGKGSETQQGFRHELRIP